jgi:hypothetical protein
MSISTDSFMRIGKGHTICEDYCIHGTEPFPYVILADGCSSSKNTDVGARILTHTAKDKIKNREYVWSSIYNAKYIATALNLKEQCLDATLLVAYELPDSNFIQVEMYGDGAIINIAKDGKIHWVDISYNNNAPYYLSYKLEAKRDAQYKKMGNIKEGTGVNYAGQLIKTNLPLYEPYKLTIDKKTTSAILLATDGLNSFIKNGQCLPTDAIVNQLTSFKNTNGAFIQRRCIRMISDLEKEGYHHVDDFSVGGFYFNE